MVVGYLIKVIVIAFALVVEGPLWWVGPVGRAEVAGLPRWSPVGRPTGPLRLVARPPKLVAAESLGRSPQVDGSPLALVPGPLGLGPTKRQWFFTTDMAHMAGMASWVDR